ncbi:MAG TPA: hypothetical protein VIF83_11495 [Gemmatimonadaceae bacterium]|jgi:hypothetical protein
MRGYTLAAAAVTLRVSHKWLDNVLSHHPVPGVRRTRQGVRRLLSPAALHQLEIALVLTRSLGIPFSIAIPLAAEIHESGGSLDLPGARRVHIAMDLSALISDVDRRLADAVESAPTPKRGRPPKRR